MTPESLLYLPLNIHVGARSEKVYAPMFPTPVWANEGLSAYILTQSSRSLQQGLYVWDGGCWRFTMPQPVLSDILIRGSTVDVYVGLSSPLVVGSEAVVFKNGILFEPRLLEGGAVFCVLTHEEAGEASAFLTAARDLSGHRVIKATPAGADYASCDVLTDSGAVIGISGNAALAGSLVRIQTDGDISEPSWNWIVGKPVFNGLNGLLTQTSPSVGYALVIGLAIESTTVLISVKQPIVLI